MEERISEFIADYIPKRITKETRYKLQYELENHIYDRIDYYREIGYTEEESLEKALDDFGNDEETKEQIKTQLGGVHRPFTLADLFVFTIPITVGLVLILYIFTSALYRTHEFMYLALVPMLMWGIMYFLRKATKPHHIFKNIVAFILVVPYFTLIFPAFLILHTTLHTSFEKDNCISGYQSFMIDEETNKKEDILLPHPKDIGNPIDANSFVVDFDSSLSDPTYFTWIFRYSPDEYAKLKDKFNNSFEYMETYPDYDCEKDIDITRQCSFTVYNFNFKTINVPYDEDDEDYGFKYNGYWALIGTNDETCEIAFIYLTPERYSPTFDEEFIKEDCGWKYYYTRKWFHIS